MSDALAALVGESPVMRELRALIERAALLRLPALIQGPTGAGKELVAHALHAASGRTGRFVPFNVCAIAETMFEDDLFGHVPGAFTGATGQKPGYLAEADGGTLFLDEIGGLALPPQLKLLRAIETGEFRPVGAKTNRKSDFRVVAATNESLDDLVREGRFRPDLAERLRGITIDVPPLRERLEDIPALARHFGSSLSNGGARFRLTAGAIRTLQRHEWPGNVRELRHVVERAVGLSGRRVLRREEIRVALGWEGARLPSHLPTLSEDHPDAAARQRLIEVLEACAWDTVRAAGRLGVHRATIYRRMEGLGIATPRTTRKHRNVEHRNGERSVRGGASYNGHR